MSILFSYDSRITKTNFLSVGTDVVVRVKQDNIIVSEVCKSLNLNDVNTIPAASVISGELFGAGTVSEPFDIKVIPDPDSHNCGPFTLCDCYMFDSTHFQAACIIFKEDSNECDECDGSGTYFIDGKPQKCICSESQDSGDEGDNNLLLLADCSPTWASFVNQYKSGNLTIDQAIKLALIHFIEADYERIKEEVKRKTQEFTAFVHVGKNTNNDLFRLDIRYPLTKSQGE